MKKLVEDNREIAVLVFSGDVPAFEVGKHGVTKIEAYEEFGQGNYVPWFAVWIDGKLHARVNAAAVASVIY